MSGQWGLSMIKVVFCLRKRRDISDEEFHRYWLENHGELVMDLANSTLWICEEHTVFEA